MRKFVLCRPLSAPNIVRHEESSMHQQQLDHADDHESTSSYSR